MSARNLAALAVSALLGLACAPTPYAPPSAWRGQATGSRARFHQSCGAACGAPVSASTGEFLAPTVVRTGQVLEKLAQSAEALQGLLTVSRFLDEAQKKTVEEILVACVKEANTKVDDELFGKGRSLPDSECDRAPTVREKLAPTWQRHLGVLKHAAAFDCIQHRLSEKYPDNFSIEPRLRRDELTGEVLLTDRWRGSLQPDVVLHFARNITRVQCIYDLKFPCGYAVGANPWHAEALAQMKTYGNLGGECFPALITPQLAIVRRPPAP